MKISIKHPIFHNIFILGLFLSLLTLTGCGGKKDSIKTENTASGRYVEQQIASIEDAGQVMGLYFSKENELIFYTVCSKADKKVLERCVLSADKKELNQTPVIWAEGLEDILDISEAEDGTTYLITINSDFQVGLYRKAGNTAELISVPELIQDNKANADVRQLCGIRSLPGGDFLLLYGSSGISHYSGADASFLKKYPVMGYNWNVDIYNNTLLAAGLEKNELLSYNLSSGQPEPPVTFEQLSYSACYGMDEISIYIADSTGIYRQSQTDWEKLVDGNFTSLSMPSIAIEDITSDGSDGFFAILSTEGKLNLVHYSYDPNIPTVPDTALTIFGLKDNNTIRQAISIFQQQNPNVQIVFQVMSEQISSVNTEEQIKTLNTELLNGNGPDILLLDGLPVKSYMEKGILIDLTEQVNQLELIKNLIHAYEYKGRCYGIPSRFTIPVMMGTSDTLKDLHSLHDLANCIETNQKNNSPFLTPSPYLSEPNGMIMDYYNVCSTSFVKTDSIDETALASYLSDMLHIQQIQEAAVSQTDITAGSSGKLELFELMGICSIGEENELFYTQELPGDNNVTILPINADQKIEPVFGGTYYTPRCAVGITSSSKQQELAQQFISLLLSQTVQDTYLYDGFPINSQSFDKMIESAEKIQTNKTLFSDICQQLNTPIFVNQTIKEAVQSQIEKLLDGTITPQEAAFAAVEKTKLYLTE